MGGGSRLIEGQQEPWGTRVPREGFDPIVGTESSERRQLKSKVSGKGALVKTFLVLGVLFSFVGFDSVGGEAGNCEDQQLSRISKNITLERSPVREPPPSLFRRV